MTCQSVEIVEWRFGNDEPLSFRTFHHLIDQNGSCGTVQCLLIIFGMVHKNKIPRYNNMDLIDPGHLKLGSLIPVSLAVQPGSRTRFKPHFWGLGHFQDFFLKKKK